VLALVGSRQALPVLVLRPKFCGFVADKYPLVMFHAARNLRVQPALTYQ
jgi:hypothetical protein